MPWQFKWKNNGLLNRRLSVRVASRVQKSKLARKSKSKYKIKENLYRCECGREFEKHQSLNVHFSHCLIHRKGKPLNRDNKIWREKCLRWNKGLKKETDERIKKNSRKI